MLCKEIFRIFNKNKCDVEILKKVFFTLNQENQKAENMLAKSETFKIQVLNKSLKVVLIRVRLKMFAFPQWFYVSWQFDNHKTVQGRLTRF